MKLRYADGGTKLPAELLGAFEAICNDLENMLGPGAEEGLVLIGTDHVWVVSQQFCIELDKNTLGGDATKSYGYSLISLKNNISKIEVTKKPALKVTCGLKGDAGSLTLDSQNSGDSDQLQKILREYLIPNLHI